MVSQVTVARHLQSAHKAFQRAAAAPGVVMETQVSQGGHWDECLLSKGAQTVVLKQQGGETGQARERPFLHQHQLILLQVQALQARELRERSVSQDLDAVPGQQQVVWLAARPGEGGVDGAQVSLLAVQEVLL